MHHCCNGTTVSIMHYECVLVALRIQHAIRMRRILYCHLWPARLHDIFTLSHKLHDFREKKII